PLAGHRRGAAAGRVAEQAAAPRPEGCGEATPPLQHDENQKTTCPSCPPSSPTLCGSSSKRCFPNETSTTPWVVTGHASLTGSSSTNFWRASSWAAPISSTPTSPARRPRCAPVATSGYALASSNNSTAWPSRPTTRPSASTCTTSWSTDASSKHRAEEKTPDAALSTAANLVSRDLCSWTAAE